MRFRPGLRRPPDTGAATPAPAGYGYFDEAYFERGELRGTAYNDYRRSSRRSPTYLELAERIIHVFEPKRALEVGCATGMIVKHLNDRGCEAFGIDVSEWAVEHREHRNVMLAGAEELPFDDGSFDLVYSVHALEHIPADLEERALGEMTRVAAPGAFQFHLLPIIGQGPYAGRGSVEGLRKDPTHNLLRTFDEWMTVWGATGWRDTGLVVLIHNDTESFELTSCQYVLSRTGVDRGVVHRARESNIDAARAMFIEAKASRASPPSIPAEVLSDRPSALDQPSLLTFEDETWLDVSRALAPPRSFEGAVFQVTTVLTGEEPQRMRLALVDGQREAITGDYRNVSERWVDVPPGLARTRLALESFVELRGSLDLRAVEGLHFGGQAKGCRVEVRIDVERGSRQERIL